MGQGRHTLRSISDPVYPQSFVQYTYLADEIQASVQLQFFNSCSFSNYTFTFSHVFFLFASSETNDKFKDLSTTFKHLGHFL